jgi:hypothetical protein
VPIKEMMKSTSASRPKLPIQSMMNSVSNKLNNNKKIKSKKIKTKKINTNTAVIKSNITPKRRK